MEVLCMAGKLLRNISPDKIENRDAECKQYSVLSAKLKEMKEFLHLLPAYGVAEILLCN
jgi:hypothetical protein